MGERTTVRDACISIWFVRRTRVVLTNMPPYNVMCDFLRRARFGRIRQQKLTWFIEIDDWLNKRNRGTRCSWTITWITTSDSKWSSELGRLACATRKFRSDGKRICVILARLSNEKCCSGLNKTVKSTRDHFEFEWQLPLNLTHYKYLTQTNKRKNYTFDETVSCLLNCKLV